jgi:hypothetical protein
VKLGWHHWSFKNQESESGNHELITPKNTKYHTLTLSIKPNAKPLKPFQKKVNGKLVINDS